MMNCLEIAAVTAFHVPQDSDVPVNLDALMNFFNISIYNSDYSSRVFVKSIDFSNGLTRWNLNGSYLGWTPSQTDWNQIKANNGTFHWVIGGGLKTGSYTTGFYFGGVNDITFQI
jgi:hypothetical protein